MCLLLSGGGITVLAVVESLPGATGSGFQGKFSMLLRELFPEEKRRKMVSEHGLLAQGGCLREGLWAAPEQQEDLGV